MRNWISVRSVFTPYVRGFVVCRRWGIAVCEIPGHARRVIAWVPGRRLPIVHPPFPTLMVGGPGSYLP